VFRVNLCNGSIFFAFYPVIAKKLMVHHPNYWVLQLQCTKRWNGTTSQFGNILLIPVRIPV